MPYGPVWKEHRRIFHNQFNATIHEHRQIQEPAAAELLVLLLRSPGRFLEHLEQYVVSGGMIRCIDNFLHQLHCSNYHAASVRLKLVT